ncbi:hypothetical protein ACFV2J_13170, partial [Streptomyces sp. NPDC059668]
MTAESVLRMLLLFTPGAPREEFFEGMSETGDAADAERAESFDRYDQYFVDQYFVGPRRARGGPTAVPAAGSRGGGCGR